MLPKRRKHCTNQHDLDVKNERLWKSKISYLFTYLLTYLRSWALLEEPLIGQPLKNFPEFYGTRRFITVFTRALHWSLSWALSNQSILILSTHLRLGLPNGLFPSGMQYPISIHLLPHSCYMPHPSHPSSLDHSNYTWRRVQVMKLLFMQFSPTSKISYN
jgi:hypothetical protein